jgi:hypothetical protein
MVTFYVPFGVSTKAMARAMRIDHTAFGEITIGGKTYEHDVVIRLSGEVVKRKKKLSKRLYGTSHIVSKDEAKFVFEKGCRQLILGSRGMCGCPRRPGRPETSRSAWCLQSRTARKSNHGPDFSAGPSARFPRRGQQVPLPQRPSWRDCYRKGALIGSM